MTCSWAALGVPQGQWGPRVDWVGHSIMATRKQVTATIKEDFLRSFRSNTVEILKQNVLSLDALRSYAGSANHIARLLWSLRLDFPSTASVGVVYAVP